MNKKSFIAGFAFLWSLLQAPLAQAAAPSILCEALGRPCPVVGEELKDVIIGFAGLLLDLVAGAAMFFIIWGGILMITSLGDESKYTSGRMSVIYACIGLAVALSADMFLFILTGIGGAGDIRPAIQAALNLPIQLLNVIFSAVIVFAAFRLVLARGKSDAVESARRALIYAIIGAIVVNAAKAIYSGILQIFV